MQFDTFLHPYADNFIPVIPIEQETDIFHTDTHPFCLDPTCACHEDTVLIAPIAQQDAEGLLTPDEAIRTIKGEML